MRVIGFGAHPDDVEIFFLGALLTYRAEGHDIGWAIATNGESGVEKGYGHLSPAELGAIRHQEAMRAGALCGVEPNFLGMRDGTVGVDSNASSLIADAVKDLAPDLIITHAPNDYHEDHRALSEWLSKVASGRVPILLADTMRGIHFDPSLYIDITTVFDEKCSAIRCHTSQQPEKYVHIARTMNAFRGLQYKLPNGHYAEGFRCDSVMTESDLLLAGRGFGTPSMEVARSGSSEGTGA